MKGPFSEGLETLTQLARCSGFTAELGALIRQPGGAERAVDALRREFFLTSNNERPLVDGEYRVPVTYAALPSFAVLENEFGKSDVSNLFDGRAFQKHASCADIDETHNGKIFLLKHFNRAIESDDAIAEMDKLGYRPATHLEAYAFAKANPELQRKFWIVALGSFVVHDGHRFVAVLRGSSQRRFLDTSLWFLGEWDSSRRFLFVRK